MQFDYYALRRAELLEVFNELEQADIIALDQTKDQQIRKEAKELLEKSSRNAVKIDPHLAYLWFWVRKVEAEKKNSEHASLIANAIREAWHKGLQTPSIPNAFQLSPDVSDVKHMPPLSFILCIPFKLQKPYISKDERDFYLLDNPIRKEKIFQAPMVAASSWKGALRAALWRLNHKENDDIAIRLLGSPRGSEEHQAGRLYFFPTFFSKIGLEVINPHSRATGVGERGPILMECVPEGVGKLLLLYVPFGHIGQGEDKRRDEVARDLEVLAEGVRAMLTTYGFGAKTSSGYGTAREQLVSNGKLALRAELSEAASPPSALPQAEPPAVVLPRYLVSPSQLHPDFCKADGSIKSESEYRALLESCGKCYKKKDSQAYAKAKSWWEREGQQAAKGTKPELVLEATQASTEKVLVSEWAFSSLSEMVTQVKIAASRLREGGKI